jgi:hypothetical protein
LGRGLLPAGPRSRKLATKRVGRPSRRPFDAARGLFYKAPAMAQGINPDRMFDRRVVQRNIRTGRVNKAEYSAFISSLPDLSQQIRPHDDGGDDDGFDVREARAQARQAPPRPVFDGPRPQPSFAAAPVAPESPPTPTPTPTPTPVSPVSTQEAPTPAAPPSMPQRSETPSGDEPIGG